MSWALEKSQYDCCNSVQISSFEWVLSQSVKKSSCHLIILLSKLFSVVLPLFTSHYISYVLFTLFVSDLIAHRVYLHNMPIQEIIKTWIQEAHVLFQGNSICKDLLCLSLKCDKVSSLGERQYYVLFKPCLSFVYDKAFCRNQLYIYRSGNRPSKKRQSISLSTKLGHGFKPCSETGCLVTLH